MASREDVTIAPLGARRVTLAACSLALSVAACSVPTEMPEVVSLMPSQAYSDVPVVLRVETRHLRPALRIDARQGTQSPELHSLRMRLIPEGADFGASPRALEVIGWNGGDRYWVRVPAGVVAAAHTLEVTDARGTTATLPEAFVGLGPDTTPPKIEVRGLPQGGTMGSGDTVNAVVFADDGLGMLDYVRWQIRDGETRDGETRETRETNDCPEALPSAVADGFAVPAASSSGAAVATVSPSYALCAATFKGALLGDADPTIQAMSMQVWARDLAGNEAVRTFPMQVAKQPVVDTFTGRSGALGGWQPFTVRGRFFIAGSEAILGGVPIIGGVLTQYGDGSAMISGWTPPRARAQPVGVEVRSAAGAGHGDEPFLYLASPRPRDVQPPSGPTRGGTRITVRGNDLRTAFVVLYVGTSRETRQPLYNVTSDADRMFGCVPPGTGTVSLWAYDPVTGDGELPMAFTYQDPPAGDPDPPPDPPCVLK